MIKYSKSLCLALAVGLFAPSLKAQINDVGTELVKPFKAQLAESKKQEAQPLLPDLDTTAGQKLTYLVPERIVSVNYPEPNIRPLAMPVPKPPKSLNFYTKAGIGFPLSPLLELSYHNSNNDKFRFGATAKHHSSQGNLEDQVFGKTSLNLNGDYFLSNGLVVGGALNMDLNNYRYYGYHQLLENLGDSLYPFAQDSSGLAEDSLKQRYLTVGANIHLFNAKNNKQEMNYRADLDLYNTTSYHGVGELNIRPRLVFEKWLGNSRSPQHRLFANAELLYSRYTTTDSSQNRSLAQLHAGADLNFGNFKSRIGARLGSNAGQFFVLPDIELSYTVLGGQFVPYAGWSGSIRENTLMQLSTYNPFLDTERLHWEHTQESRFYGGLKGQIKRLGYDFNVSYANLNQQPLFYNTSESNYLKFGLAYDTLSRLTVAADVELQIMEELYFKGALAFNNYSGGTAEAAYHLPVMETSFGLKYKKGNLEVGADLFVNAGVPYLPALATESETLGGLFDLNLNATYWLGKGDQQRFAFFVEGNNLLNNKYQRWYLYQQLGINGKIGVIAKF